MVIKMRVSDDGHGNDEGMYWVKMMLEKRKHTREKRKRKIFHLVNFNSLINIILKINRVS